MNRMSLLALLIPLAIAGCSRTEIQSRVRPHYATRLENLCVAIQVPHEGDAAFFEGLKTQLEAQLKGATGRQAVQVFSGSGPGPNGRLFTPGGTIELGPKAQFRLPEIDKASLPAMAGFQPSHLLKILHTSMGGSQADAQLELELTEWGSGTVVWRAQQSLGWGSRSVQGRMVAYATAPRISADPAACAGQIIEQMRKDKLL